MVVEILVHINARCRFEDDKRYKEIANQVINFVPQTRLPITTKGNSLSCSGSASSQQQHPTYESHSMSTFSSRSAALSSGKSAMQGYNLSKKRSFDQYNKEDLVHSTEMDLQTIHTLLKALPVMVAGPAAHILDATVVADCSGISELDHVSMEIPQSYQRLRMIKSHERGYWSFAFTVAPHELIRLSRQADQSSKRAHRKRHPPNTLWSLEEFFAFWQRISNQISNGKLGSVRLFRKKLTISTARGICGLNLRLYCWSQMLSYLHDSIRRASADEFDAYSASWTGSDGKVAVIWSKDAQEQFDKI